MVMWRIVAAAAVLGLAACNDSDKPASEGAEKVSASSAQDGLARAIGNTGDLSETAKLIRAAGLEQAFNGIPSYTLFAPTDAAISALPESERKYLESPEGRPQLIALLSQHAVPGYVGQAELKQGLTREGGRIKLATLGSAPLTLSKQGDAIVLGQGADAPRLVGEPIAARNGVIYPIDGVLMPSAKK